MPNHMAVRRGVITSRSARSRVRDWESSDRLAVPYETGGMRGALPAAHSLPGITQSLSPPRPRGIRRALRNSAIPMDISPNLCGAVVATRRSHGSLLRFACHYRMTISFYDTRLASSSIHAPRTSPNQLASPVPALLRPARRLLADPTQRGMSAASVGRTGGLHGQRPTPGSGASRVCRSPIGASAPGPVDASLFAHAALSPRVLRSGRIAGLRRLWSGMLLRR
jgi:hypothetical protein